MRSCGGLVTISDPNERWTDLNIFICQERAQGGSIPPLRTIQYKKWANSHYGTLIERQYGQKD
jgi:hypothetical protein